MSFTMTLPFGSARASVGRPSSSLLVYFTAPNGRGLMDCADAVETASSDRVNKPRRFISLTLGRVALTDDHARTGTRRHHHVRADRHAHAAATCRAGADVGEIPRIHVLGDETEFPHLRG